MTIILAFDTSTQTTSVALSIDDQVITEVKDTPRQHSDHILPMIDGRLSQAGCQGRDVDVIAITNGPGSFMGSRLSVGVAQGLGYAWDCKVCLVSTLQCLAQTAYALEGLTHVISAWDARMGEVYWGEYALQDGLMQPLIADQLSKPGSVMNKPGVELVCNIDLPNFDRRHDIVPQARSLLPFVRAASNKDQLLSPLEIEPVYLRASVLQNRI